MNLLFIEVGQIYIQQRAIKSTEKHDVKKALEEMQKALEEMKKALEKMIRKHEEENKALEEMKGLFVLGV